MEKLHRAASLGVLRALTELELEADGSDSLKCTVDKVRHATGRVFKQLAPKSASFEASREHETRYRGRARLLAVSSASQGRCVSRKAKPVLATIAPLHRGRLLGHINFLICLRFIRLRTKFTFSFKL